MSRSVTTTLLVGCLAVTACSDSTTDPMTDTAWALAFDGVDDLVTIPDAVGLDLVNALTVSAWFYFTGGVSGEPGLVQKDGPGSFGRYGLWVRDDEIDFCVYIDGGSQQCMFSSTLPLNTWTHVAGVFDGTEMRLYLDGVLNTSASLVGTVSTSDEPLYIGADPTQGLYLPGHIDEVSVWNIARSQSEIMIGMDTPMMGNEAGLVGYWRLDEGMGQTVGDGIPNGINGFLGASGASASDDPTWVETSWPHS